jgi:hypothetical protein
MQTDGRTDGYDEANRRFFATMRTRLTIIINLPRLTPNGWFRAINPYGVTSFLSLTGKGDSRMAFLNGTYEEYD